jgi:RNA polymerase sigma-70 factor, ECF subfamily
MTKLILELKDETIVAAFKATKSAQHFKALVARHKNRLYSTAHRILGCPDEAEEIVQETFIKALQNIDKFESNASLSAWLYAITHNLCVDALRLKHKQGEFRHTSFDPQSVLRNHDLLRRRRHIVNQLADRVPGPAEQAELTEQMKMVVNSLTSISDKQRIVVILHDIEGLSYEDIAHFVGASIGTVRSRLHYGRNKLKKILHPYLTHQNLDRKGPRSRKRKVSSKIL